MSILLLASQTLRRMISAFSGKEMKTMFFLLSLLLPNSALAAELSATAQGEISHLFSYLEKSGCDFYRNGTWYKGNTASAHLRKKYQYLRDKGLLSSTESFIERAATQSSVSAKSYQVRCGASDVFDSGPWFRAELAKYRKSSANHSFKPSTPDDARP